MNNLLLETKGNEYAVRLTYCEDSTWYAEGYVQSGVTITEFGNIVPSTWVQHKNWFGSGQTVELALQGLRQAINLFDLEKGEE